jgi:exodeoxyribonuclease-3
VRIATWNVNSVRARKQHLLDYLRADRAPDVLVLQELKVEEGNFPRAEVEEAGYHALVSGQKTYNGVAILSREPATERMRGLPDGDGDVQSRYLEAEIAGVVVASVYAPNGNPVGTEKFAYKLAWMRRMQARAASLFEEERTVAIGGDWNVCPTALDVWDETAMAADALLQPESRAAWRSLVWQGWTDAYRALHPDDAGYSYWDYQAGAWPRDHGLRIDHLLLSPHAAQRLSACDVDRGPRGKDSPSDHTPVWCDLTV